MYVIVISVHRYHVKADAAGIGIPESDIIVSLILEHSGTGQGPLSQLPDWFRHLLHFGTGLADAGQSGIPAFTKAVQSRTPCWRIDIHTGGEKRHPARRHYWWWKENLHIYNTCGGMTPCKSIPLRNSPTCLNPRVFFQLPKSRNDFCNSSLK